MSKGAIMLSGGGSGKLFAAIGVTYPAGSTLTCTNGTKTLKAKTTSGQWVFAIPEAGTWTVTATDGTNTKSQSVSITTEGQWESVNLSFRRNLYTNGDENVAWTVGNILNKIMQCQKESDRIRFYTTESVTCDHAQAYTTSTVNLSDYSKLKIKGSSLLSGELYFCIYSTVPGINDDLTKAPATLTIGTAVGEFENALDIEQISGDYYVVARCTASYPAKGDHFYITEIWLE